MNVTLDLPTELVKRVKLRALHDGMKLKDAFANILQKGMVTVAVSDASPSQGGNGDRSKLPLIKCKYRALPEAAITPERAAEILLAQEVASHHAAG